jgi:hypothetical protein
MFSNKFVAGFFFVCKVGFNKIIAKFLSIKGNFLFLKHFDPKILASFELFTFSLEFSVFLPFFPPRKFPS